MPHYVVIYHRADFDGLFSREIARRALPSAELIGWDYGDPIPVIPPSALLYMIDISIAGLMDHPNLTWIDHHKTAIDQWAAGKNGEGITGLHVDGVAACRLAWQWFFGVEDGFAAAIPKENYTDRLVIEPMAVRLAGEYDVWDKRDPDADLFQHGLRAQELTDAIWDELLDGSRTDRVAELLERGRYLQYAQQQQDASIIKRNGFTVVWEGLRFLACNASRYNSHLFTAAIQPEHEALLGFNWTGRRWRVSLYGAPLRPDLDLSGIARKYGGGGHRQACGFEVDDLPFSLT
jgi:hypothetical protein